ncbi:MAG: CBS domain-containing protein [Rhodospirillales bacterium]|nr:CBS domain-containing protein [Rhodospirillales bacterium]MCW8861321.1 CBS domain-containing protein [Rhodospirillales bacterium]MCW8951075.1 CBS domain-containing protein [Rhodospirillales bacterium]MCW8971224.1 CBS domain-containing protein [Rhodospirillales bacterium]MCW9039496.1 CBS domain-containing protein [Rhodospirillales bacterium]
MPRKIIPDLVNNQTIHELPENATAREAAKLMMGNHIGAVFITNDGILSGIVTERDLTWRVIAAGLNPDETRLGDVMTRNPDVLDPDDRPFDALELMRVRNYRHLPVVRDGRVVGMVSARDLYADRENCLEQDVREREAFIFGENYGTG